MGNSSLGEALLESLLNFVIIETVALQYHGSALFTVAWLFNFHNWYLQLCYSGFLDPKWMNHFSSFIWVDMWTHMVANTRVWKVHILHINFSSWCEGDFLTHTVQEGLWVVVLYGYTVLREMQMTYCKWTSDLHLSQYWVWKVVTLTA